MCLSISKRFSMTSLLSVKSMAKGLVAIIVAVVFVLPAMAQETTPGDQKAEQGENARQDERMQKQRDGKREGKQGEKQRDKENRPGTEGRRRQSPPKGGDAAGAGQRIAQMLKRIDADGDGAISKSEAPERLLARFDKIDANGDEKIDREEITAMMKMMGGRKGDRPPTSDKPPGLEEEPGSKSDNKNKRKMRDRDGRQDVPSGGSVDPIRPGKDG